MRIRSAIVLSAVAALLLGAAVPAQANHFDSNASTGAFNPQLQVTVGSTMVNRPGPVRIHLSQADHEDPPAVSTFKTGDWQFPFPSLRQAETAAGVPTNRCRDAMDGYNNSPNGTGTGTNVDFSKRTDGKIVRAEKVGTGHLEVHADGVSRPGNPIVWNGDAAFIRYDALASEARLCFLFITTDTRVTSIPDPDPTGGGDDIEGVTELIAEFPVRLVGSDWQTESDLTDLATDSTFQTLNVSVLDLDVVFFAQTKGNWQTAVDFARAPAVSGLHTYEGVFQTCPEVDAPTAPDYGGCLSNKGVDEDDNNTTGGIIRRPTSFTVTLPTPAITGPSGSGPFPANVTVSGTTVDPSTNVRLYSGATPVAGGETTSNPAGAWTMNVTLGHGNHNLTARVFDAGGESPASGVKSIVVDAIAPAAPVFLSPGAGATVPTGLVEISGSAEPNSVVNVYEGLTSLGQVNASPGGSWSLSKSFTVKGPHTLSATATDGVGNLSVTSDRTFNVTTPSPVISVPGEGAFLSNSSVTFVGTSEVGSTVELSEGGVPFASVTAVDGTWTAGPFTFSETLHTITAIATGADTFVSLPTVRSFTIDLTAPGTPVITSPIDGSTVSTSVVPLAGTSEPFSTVQLFEDGATIGSALTSAAGAWSTGIEMANGAHTVIAKAVDRAGNESGLSAPVTFNVAALLVTITDPANNTFQPGTVTVKGTAEAGALFVLVFDGGIQVGKAAVTDGTWQKTLTLTSGIHKLTARGTNGEVDGPISNTRTFTVDAAPPRLTIIKPSGYLLFQIMLLEPTVRALAEEVHAFDSGIAGFELTYEPLLADGETMVRTGSCTGCGGKDAAVSDTPELGIGLWTVTIKVTDRVGNISTDELMLFSLGF
jgi:hypothetical protein